MSKKSFRPGFRLSISDCVFLAFVVALSVWLQRYPWYFSFIVLFASGHFFLFCNVFRVSRTPEIIWSIGFVILAGLTLYTGIPGWTTTIIVSLLLSILLIYHEMKHPLYHGVGWQVINPSLAAWMALRPKKDSK